MDMIDLYSDYLISGTGLATATGLSDMLDQKVGHDMVTKFLTKNNFDSKQLWSKIKGVVREVDDIDNVLVFDDTIIEKPYTDESDLICRHFDHKTGTNVKGTNLVTCLLHSEKKDLCIPVGYELVFKPILSCDVKTKKVKRKGTKTKNEMVQELFLQAVENKILFKYVLFDSRYSSNENLKLITSKGKHTIAEIKSNRLIALSLKERDGSKFININNANLNHGTVYSVYLKGFQDEVLLVRQVFKNKDGNTGERYLVCTDVSLTFDQITSLYKRRWKIEESYKSLKCNAGLAKSPTKSIKTQANHFFMSIYTYFKLELLASKATLNAFCLKSKLYIKALKASYQELQLLKNQADFGILA